MTLQEFIDQNTNQGLDFDGYYGDQCVDLAQFYNRDVLGNDERFTGNAVDIFGQQPDKFDWIANTPEGVPTAGDIMIWEGQLNGGPGHVSVFIEGDTSQFSSFDQNWPTNSLCHLQHHTYNYVKGWGRYKTGAVAPEEKTEMINAEQVKDLYRTLLGREASDAEAESWTTQDWPTAFYGIKDSEEGHAYSVKMTTQVPPVITVTPVSPVVVPDVKGLSLQDRLTSRKFWITVVSAAGFALHGDTNAAMAIIFAYFGVNLFDKK